MYLYEYVSSIEINFIEFKCNGKIKLILKWIYFGKLNNNSREYTYKITLLYEIGKYNSESGRITCHLSIFDMNSIF